LNIRLRLPRPQHRKHRQAHEQCHQRERHECPARGTAQQLLGDGERTQVYDHVYGEDFAAVRGFGARVEPAFDDGVEHDEGGADQDAQRQPQPAIGAERVQQRNRRAYRRA